MLPVVTALNLIYRAKYSQLGATDECRGNLDDWMSCGQDGKLSEAPGAAFILGHEAARVAYCIDIFLVGRYPS
jgi:hypothetical protein